MNSLIYVNNEKTQVIYKSYLYSATSNEYKCGSRSYKCVQKYCGSTIKVKDTAITKDQSKLHNHPELSDCEIEIMVETTQLKEMMEDDHTIDGRSLYTKIYEKLLIKYDQRELAEFWKPWSRVKETYNYYKRKNAPKQAKSKEEVKITDEYTTTITNKKFLRYDNDNKENRIMLFVSDECLDILLNTTHWHFDGTFKICPKFFYQVLTIHAVYCDEMMVCAYILLASKTTNTYLMVLAKLKEILLSLQKPIVLKTAICDFESALQQAVATIFNGVEIKGCWFHFNQALIRKLFSLGFKAKYSSDSDFKIWIRRFGALALMPIEKLLEAWQIIISNIPCEVTSSLKIFMKYFVNVWIIGKKGSTFSPSVWNRYTCETRTNNNLEGFHSDVNKLIKAHSDVNKVVKFFKSIDAETVNKYLSKKQCIDLTKRVTQRKADRIKEDNISIIQQQYRNNECDFETYFYRLTFQVAFPYGEEDNAESNNDITDDPAGYDDSIEEISDTAVISNDPHVPADTINLPNPYRNDKAFHNLLKNVQVIEKNEVKDENETSASSIIMKKSEKRKDDVPDTNTNKRTKKNKKKELDQPLLYMHPPSQTQQVSKLLQQAPQVTQLIQQQTQSNQHQAPTQQVSPQNQPTLLPSLHAMTFQQLLEVPLDLIILSPQQPHNAIVTPTTSTETDKRDSDCIIVDSKTTVTREPTKLVSETWLLKGEEWLTNGHIYIVSNLIEVHYRYSFKPTGLFHPVRYLDSKENTYFDPNIIHESPFIQILHAGNHWVTVTNYNPYYPYARPDGLGIWFLYESLNAPHRYINYLKPALKRLNMDSNSIVLLSCPLNKQKGTNDCGLFALAYAIAICEQKDPANLIFEQTTMRQHFNKIITTGHVSQFKHHELTNISIEYTEHDVNLKDVVVEI